MKRQQITIFDVAKKAGFSIATVSNVLNKRNVPIAPETIKKVVQVATGMGYRRNALAANLSRRKTYELGLVLPMFGGYFASFAESLGKIAREYGYHLSVFSSSQNMEIELRLLDMLHQRRVDGVFSHGSSIKPEIMRQLVGDGSPLVLFNAWGLPPNITQGAINIGFDEGCHEAVKLLYQKGCRTIIYVSRDGSKGINQIRLSGIKQGVEGIDDDTLQLHIVDTTDKGFIEWGDQLVQIVEQDQRSPIGIIAFDDDRAFICLTQLQKKGFSIPDRVKIIGINNDLISRNCHPTLTTIAIDYQKQAETAMRRMMSVLGEVDEKCGQSEIVIPMTVIEREST